MILIKTLREIDGAIQPYLDQRKDLRSSYTENGKLSKEEFSLAVKAYNHLKRKDDADDFTTIFDAVRKEIPGR